MEKDSPMLQGEREEFPSFDILMCVPKGREKKKGMEE